MQISHVHASIAFKFHYPLSLKIYVMEPNIFLGLFLKGIASVLCHFEHEQYLSNSVDPWCLIIEYPNDNIGFLGAFGRVMQYPLTCQKKMLWNPIYF
jgi:hypothetical protein